MKILIVGLGLIGASYAKGLIKKGHTVYGVDNDAETIHYALENDFVNDASNRPEDFIEASDLIIIALYPDNILAFLEKYRNILTSNQLVTDVCGVKTKFVYDAIELAKPATYISHHPMAGREKSGIKYANQDLFKGANFLICNHNNLPEDIEKLVGIANDLGFGRISIMSPEKHDKMIGFTSQLTHAIAVSLVNSDTEDDTKQYIGDSYRDLTRIAMINENLWSELFMANKDYLLGEIDNFEQELKKLRQALDENDTETLKMLFRQSRAKRNEMEK